MRNIVLTVTSLFVIAAPLTSASADRATCAVENIEFSGVIASVTPSVREPVMFAFGPDPSHTVVITPVTSSTALQRIPISSTVRLAIHSPSRTFMKEGEALIGRAYRFEIAVDEGCHRTLDVVPITENARGAKK